VPLTGGVPAAHRHLTPGARTAVVLLGLWALLVGVTAVAHPGFAGRSTALTIAFGLAVPGMLAIGIAVVTLSGALLDLSVSANATCAAVLVSVVLRDGQASLVAVAVALVFGLAFGAVNALVVTRLRVNPIIATLATSFVAIGVLTAVATGLQNVPNDSGLRSFGIARLAGLPLVALVMVVVLLATAAFLAYTRPGRHVLAVGGSAQSAAARGISVVRVRWGAFLFAGFCGGVGGVLLAASSNVLALSASTGVQFRAIAAVLLVGIAIVGGRGHLLALLASLVLLTTLPTAIVTWDLSSNWQRVIEGSALVIAVAVDAAKSRGRP
jgi:ribose/xylose/arabinose/galactoside ABC-type transport system permease subunit